MHMLARHLLTLILAHTVSTCTVTRERLYQLNSIKSDLYREHFAVPMGLRH